MLLLPALAVGAAAGLVAKALPNVYQATTVILVEKPKVPETFVRSTVTTRIEDRLATINQQVLSRTWLERLVTELDLFRAERETTSMEALVARMRRDVEIRILGRAKERNSFSIAYRAREPEIARDVANRLAALFIEENSKVREEQAVGTSEFLDSQLTALKATLAEQERKVAEFKERHIGQLPQQEQAALRALDRLENQSRLLADQLKGAEDRVAELRGQLATTPPWVTVTEPGGVALNVAPPPVVRAPTPDPLLGRLEQARAALRDLRSRYTDAHPDVIRMQRQVEGLEAQVSTSAAPAVEASPQPAAPTPASPPVVATQSKPNPLRDQIETDITAATREVEKHRAALAQVDEQIRDRQRQIENIPRLEQQLIEVTRDYENTRATYMSLLAKKLDAELAENLERRQKGEQFRVLDPATLPRVPIKPDRRRIVLSGLILGFGLGGALAMGLELVDRTVRRPRELRAALPDLPILGTVPIIRDPARVRRRRAIAAAVSAASLGAIVALIPVALERRALLERLMARVGELNAFEFLLR